MRSRCNHGWHAYFFETQITYCPSSPTLSRAQISFLAQCNSEFGLLKAAPAPASPGSSQNPRPTEQGPALLARSPGDSCAHSSLRSTALERIRYKTENKKSQKYKNRHIYQASNSLPMSLMNPISVLRLLGGNTSQTEMNTSSVVEDCQILLSSELVLL